MRVLINVDTIIPLNEFILESSDINRACNDGNEASKIVM
jgi:hypothetical protein